MITTKQGLLIVFEGVDGTGKSTQLSRLAAHLRDRGHEVVTTREPTEGVFGQKIRQLYSSRKEHSPESELDLFINDRKEHVSALIKPALESGKVILCDRYFLSTVAYQGAIGFDLDLLFERNSFAPDPDLALLFRAPIETGHERITTHRGDTPNDFEKKDYLNKVATIFDSLTQSYIHPIDASGSIEEVHQQVLTVVQPLLPDATTESG